MINSFSKQMLISLPLLIISIITMNMSELHSKFNIIEEITRKNKTGYRQHCTLQLQFLLVNFYFVLAQFQINRARFYLLFPTFVQFFTQIVALLLSLFSSHFNISPQKFVPHAQK